ncbi:hypothetical protein O181_001330 [Austropuccinia psidii MF-1]|uniref:Uncharacterized protein n=1 Tax=Austropuccinia psidii MF-1 TaxID=1389203 RepID=A0A9Q3BAE9_9BASI|nr:hypothetical protein [Austropuccinia psidii MF-1]
MTPALEKEGPVVSTSPEMSNDKPKGPQKKQKGPKNHQGKGKGKENWHIPYPKGYRIPKLEPSAMDSVFNMARTLMGLTAKKEGKDEQDFYTQIVDEIQFVQYIIYVDLGTFDEKLNKITSDINH